MYPTTRYISNNRASTHHREYVNNNRKILVLLLLIQNTDWLYRHTRNQSISVVKKEKDSLASCTSINQIFMRIKKSNIKINKEHIPHSIYAVQYSVL
mmetsp:Transcript_19722/g.20060  ORF Transcript_19722/g.20060 Transcript_19722/m.20060 type:complete len:97 (-) Transcript_19722:181-471(-)